jgi:GNAT superfamily N-acetyltransferase
MQLRWYDDDRMRIRHLFELADDSELQVSSYINEGRVLVAWDGDQPVAHLQLIPTTADEIELKSLAVVPERQHGGVGRMLIDAAVDAAKADGYARMTVSTGGADTGNLRFYQRCGFRLLSVERDAFTPETGYPEQMFIDGIELRDRVWLDRPL